MKCPICGKPVSLNDPEMPFCGERCRLIDLGKWADEDYRIPISSEAPALSNPPVDPAKDDDDE
ncbi:MAG: DNA gyrase inhibitor YacG [Bryobacterales bacterium]|nr:DNA gyrase inhibitor YacG [Bryobacterales bacterium]